MTWFLAYLAYGACVGYGSLPATANCISGAYQAAIQMPDRKTCERIVALNPNRNYACWARPNPVTAPAEPPDPEPDPEPAP